jgi:hypothetical protein
MELLKLSIQPFVKAYSIFQDHTTALYQPNGYKVTKEEEGSFCKSMPELIETLNNLLIQCKNLKLAMSVKAIERAIRYASGSCPDVYDIQKHFHDITNRIHDELAGTAFLQIPAAMQMAYEGNNHFSQQVIERFPSLNYDIDCSYKCFALTQYTACVFHVMRVIEGGLNATYASLRLAALIEQDRNWGSILKKISEEIKRRDAIKDNNDSTNVKQFYEDAIATLHAIKNAWRNTTMHLEKKYNEEEAKSILDCTKAFMTRIASYIDQEGQFHNK